MPYRRWIMHTILAFVGITIALLCAVIASGQSPVVLGKTTIIAPAARKVTMLKPIGIPVPPAPNARQRRLVTLPVGPEQHTRIAVEVIR